MRLQTLVSVMNLSEKNKFIKHMNLKNDAIIINQCDNFAYEKLNYKKWCVDIYSFNERGIGLSRNSALMRADSDIVLIFDEDMRYVDDYDKTIIDAFENNKKADIIIFNVVSENEERKMYTINKVKKVSKFNCGKYGAVRFAIKLNKIKNENIYFSLLFGGGAKYQCGEDSIFIKECLDKGLKIYTNPNIIGYVKQEGSTWFHGYNEKFFIDKGALFKKMYGKMWFMYTLQYLLRHKKITKKIGFINCLKAIINGTKSD